jgi:membrane protein DedA with SNARE-associated domain
MDILMPLPEWSAKVAGVIGALLVVIIGRWLERRILARQDITIV